MKMYIIRHGQTPWNARKCLQGRSDVDLNENGIYLAELTGKALRDVTFDMAFTSPLIRAKHTAQCILAGRKVPIIEDERLIEISFGIYEGCCYAEENRQVPQQWIENFFHAPQDYVAACFCQFHLSAVSFHAIDGNAASFGSSKGQSRLICRSQDNDVMTGKFSVKCHAIIDRAAFCT